METEKIQTVDQIFSRTEIQKTNLNQQDKPSFDKERFNKCREFYRARFEKLGIVMGETGKFCMTDYLAYLYMGVAKKGILFDGTTGTGKTFSLDIIRRFHGIPSAHYFTANELSAYCKDHDERPTRTLMHRCSYSDTPDEIRDICIDDIGAEPMINVYGTKVEALEYCIDELEKINKENKIYLFATTNLTEQRMEDRYGSRFVSRLSALCSRVSIIGEDRRKS